MNVGIGQRVFAKNYLERQKASGIQVGDYVEVLRIARGNEDGWFNNWTYRMDSCVGNVYKVKGLCGTSGIDLEGTDYSFPYFVLAPEKEESDDPIW